MATEIHPLTEVIARRAKDLAAIPGGVAVHEHARDPNSLTVYIYPGPPENIGAIIGKKGANIQALRLYVDALAFDLNMTVKIRVVTPDRREEGHRGRTVSPSL